MATFPIPGWTGKSVPLHWGSNSGGSDLFAPRGTPVVAVVAGTVVDAGSSAIGGNNATIRGADGLLYYFAHFDSLLVHAGQSVGEGQEIGTVGDTGNAKNAGPHLHIGIGKGIASGTGPAGGTGTGFDAVSYLRTLLAQMTGTRPPIVAPPAAPTPAPTPGTGGSAGGSVIGGGSAPTITLPKVLPELPGPFEGLASIAAQINAAVGSFNTTTQNVFSTLAWFGQPNLWKRAGLILLGLLLFLLGLVLFALSFIDRKQAEGAVKMVATAAA